MTWPLIFFTFIPGLITIQLLFGSKLASTTTATPLLFMSQMSGLLGATFLAQNIVLSSRLPYLDHWFGGMDTSIRIHRTLGIASFIVLIQHVVFLVLGRYPEFSSTLIYLMPTTKNIPYTAGILALGLMVMLIILTLFVDLPYHLWKKTHELFIWVILLGTYHGLTVTSDISRFVPLRLWMISIFCLAITAALYRRFLYKFIGPRWQYTLERIIRKGDIMELYLSPLTNPMPYYPGQFAFLVIHDKKIGNEEHPFSISSAPFDALLRFSIKISGDYTLFLTTLTAGIQVTVWGPYGRFGEKLASRKHILMIAGGIGITPFLSMIRSAISTLENKKISLYYTTSTSDEAVYDPELRELSRHNEGFSYTLHVSKENGRLTGDTIQSGIQGLSDCLVFLCGPPAMMASMSVQLRLKGVRQKNIIYEDFSFT